MPTYFSDATFRFLRGLARHNSREWFLAHKAGYEAQVRDPFRRLLTDLQEPLAGVSVHYRSDPRPVGGSLFRIQRDTRFANDKTPYKTWQGARLTHARGRQVEAPVFYLHLQPGKCFIGAGLWHSPTPVQRQVRQFIVDNPSGWKAAAHAPAAGVHTQDQCLGRILPQSLEGLPYRDCSGIIDHAAHWNDRDALRGVALVVRHFLRAAHRGNEEQPQVEVQNDGDEQQRGEQPREHTRDRPTTPRRRRGRGVHGRIPRRGWRRTPPPPESTRKISALG